MDAAEMRPGRPQRAVRGSASVPRPPPPTVGEEQERTAAWLRAAVRCMAWGMMMVPFRVAPALNHFVLKDGWLAKETLHSSLAPVVAAILDSYTIACCARRLYCCALPADGSMRGWGPCSGSCSAQKAGSFTCLRFVLMSFPVPLLFGMCEPDGGHHKQHANRAGR